MRLTSTSRWRRRLLRGLSVVLLIGVVGVLVLTFSIELGLKQACGMATRAYPGDKVDALMRLVKSEGSGYNAYRYHANSRALWALGQLGNNRAVPFLRDLLTGQPCDHETNLCQGEITKALRKLERNEFNLPRFLWRGILNG